MQSADESTNSENKDRGRSKGSKVRKQKFDVVYALPHDADPILRIHGVCQLVGVSRASIYVWINKQSFPRGQKIGPRARGWRASEVSAWLKGRAAA